jgi:hypothetical protein
MRSPKCKELYKTIAKEYGLTSAQVEEIACSPFEFQIYMQSKIADKYKWYFPSLRIPFFGTFKKNGRVYSLCLRNKIKRDESINIQQGELGS